MKSSRPLLILLMAFSMQSCAQGNAPVPAAKPAAAKPAKTAFTGADAVVAEALRKIAPGVEITRIQPSPMPGLREVIVDGRVLYVSTDGKYLLQGQMIDLATRSNLSEASEAVERKTLLAGIPAAQKISFAPANPKYRVTVFTDIDCGFCRQMHSQIAEYNKLGIAVDYLFFPRAGIGSESFQKAVNVWCAPDRKVAMTMAKAGKTLPKKNCSNFVTMDYHLGQKAGVDGTPAVFDGNGRQLGGYLPPDKLLAALQGKK